MDLVASILCGLRAAAPLLAETRLGEDSGVDLASSGGSLFHYVTKGQGWVSAQGESHHLSAGDLVLLPHGLPHRIAMGEDPVISGIQDILKRDNLPIWSHDNGLSEPLLLKIGTAPPALVMTSGLIMFDRPGSDQLLAHLPALMVFRRLDPAIRPWLAATADFIAIERQRHVFGYEAISLRIIELLLTAALRTWLAETPHESGWLKGLNDPIVSKVLRAMHDHPGRRWHLGTLAAAGCCSRSKLAEHFRSTIGETPFAYLTRLRMDIAKDILKRTRRSVEDVAKSLGYSSARTFARIFTAVAGESPSRYRMRHAAVCRYHPPQR